jgi:hypothetical protein
MSKPVALLVAVVIAAVFWGIIVHDMLPRLRILQRLARLGVHVTGAVTAKEPMNHASVRYEYFADGVRYSGDPCGAQERFDSVRVGDPIAVTYLPESPATSVCGDAQQAYDTNRGIAFIVVPCFTVLTGGLGAFALYRRFNPRGSRNSSDQSLEPTSVK